MASNGKIVKMEVSLSGMKGEPVPEALVEEVQAILNKAADRALKVADKYKVGAWHGWSKTRSVK